MQIYKKLIYIKNIKYTKNGYIQNIKVYNIIFIFIYYYCFDGGGIQYFAMIRMGGFVITMQKSEWVLSEGVL